MRGFAPCLAVIVAGVVLLAGAVVAMATAPTARGGHATTTKAPTLPKQSRGQVALPKFFACSAPGGVCVRIAETGIAGD